MSDGELIPVTILTGFLGSGKTTILNRLLTSPEFSDTAVIINEFGEIGLDHLLVNRSTESLILLNNGCLCCTVRGDLVETFSNLEALLSSGDISPFRRVIVETTGLADPAPILHTLMVDPTVTRQWRLAGVVTTIDAVNGARTLDARREAANQAAVADRILLTKSDIASERELDVIRGKLRGLNPSTPIIDVIGGRVDPAEIFNVGYLAWEGKPADVGRLLNEDQQLIGQDHHENRPRHDHHHNVNRHDERIKAQYIIIDEPVSWKDFSYWLELLAAMRGEKMLRVKGIVTVSDHPDRPVVVHGVQHVFHPPVQLDSWPSDDRRTRIVFITHDMEIDELENTLRKFVKVDRTVAVRFGSA